MFFLCFCIEHFMTEIFVLSEVALQRTSSMDETGPVVWHLALCLLLSWILVGAALFKGIKSSGKVSASLQEH